MSRRAPKLSRDIVAEAFARLGDVDRYAEWARANPDDFYNKHFTRTIEKHMVVEDNRSVEDLIFELAGEVEDAVVISSQQPPALVPAPAQAQAPRIAAAPPYAPSPLVQALNRPAPPHSASVDDVVASIMRTHQPTSQPAYLSDDDPWWGDNSEDD